MDTDIFGRDIFVDMYVIAQDGVSLFYGKVIKFTDSSIIIRGGYGDYNSILKRVVRRTSSNTKIIIINDSFVIDRIENLLKD
jgi:hypothetical protein